LPLCVEDAQKLNMVDLLNRVNYQILFGKWCLDNEDGEISHITTHLADPDILPQKNWIYYLIPISGL